jgi:hypothetical protein
MRMTMPIAIAATLLAATPALAQNESTANNAVAADTTVVAADNAEANAAMPVDNPVRPGTVAETTPTETTAPAPAPEERKGFPWGVLGLLGLLGLIPRLRRG